MRKGGHAEPGDTAPVLITSWGKAEVAGGVLYVSFFSGAIEHVVAMGPAVAVKGVAMVNEALGRKTVEVITGRSGERTK